MTSSIIGAPVIAVFVGAAAIVITRFGIFRSSSTKFRVFATSIVRIIRQIAYFVECDQKSEFLVDVDRHLALFIFVIVCGNAGDSHSQIFAGFIQFILSAVRLLLINK